MNYKNGVAKKLSLFASFSLVLSINQALGESWPEKTYNPKPDADDVILPMPCDGSMVFRRVEVPVAGPLDDMSIHLGQDGGDWGFIEHTHSAFISGSFTQPKEKTRYYLIAKYEMSSLQYQSIMNDSCPSPSRKMSVPITNISWFDAVNAADKYNIWLRKNAEKEIPKEDGKSGFLRLPTEIEWEFSARGGMKVNSAEFRDLRYPMNELKEYEWFSGSQSANGRLQLVGLLKSNPLGLYDILGNADEMVFDPFYLNKLDRFHGQAGGYIVRGGNYLTEESAIRSAARKEVNYYDDDHQFTSKTTGMRLALVSPTMTSTSRVKAIEASWNNLGSSKVDAAEKVTKDTAKELGSLASDVSDSKLKNKLKDLESQLRASNQKQQEEREQSIEDALNAAKKAKEEMALLNAQNEKIMKEARAERDAMLKEAREMREKMIADSKADAVAEGARMIEQAKTAINAEKNAAMSELKAQVSTLSLEIAEKLLKDELSNKEAQTKLVDKLLGEAKLN